jgi:hypothetical protein
MKEANFLDKNRVVALSHTYDTFDAHDRRFLLPQLDNLLDSNDSLFPDGKCAIYYSYEKATLMLSLWRMDANGTKIGQCVPLVVKQMNNVTEVRNYRRQEIYSKFGAEQEEQALVDDISCGIFLKLEENGNSFAMDRLHLRRPLCEAEALVASLKKTFVFIDTASELVECQCIVI